jgi:thioredoxin 1
MEKIKDPDHLDHVLADNSLVLLYFSGSDCSVCQALKPKIEIFVPEQFPDVKVFEVATAEQPELVGRFSVFTVPVLLFMVEGREYIREARNVSITELSKKMEKIVTLYSE